MAKERTERDLERLQNKEDSSDSLRRRLRETEVHTHKHWCHRHCTHAQRLSYMRSVFFSCYSVFSVIRRLAVKISALKVLNNLIEAQTCSVMNRCLSESFCFGIWLFPGCRDLPPVSSSCEWHQIKLDQNAQQTFIFFSLRSSVCIHYVATVWFWTQRHFLWLFLWS